MANSLFEKALRHFNQGNIQEANRLCQTLLSNTPDHAQGLCLQGMISRQTGQSADAIQFITRALEKEPSNPNFWNHLGLAVQDLGHRHEAINMYRQGLAFKQNHAELLLNLATALTGEGKISEADNCYQQALALKDASVELRINYGNFLMAQGKSSLAIQQYQQAVQQQATHWLAHFNLANAYLQTAQYELAIQQFESAVTANPGFEKSYFFLAHAYKQAGNPDGELETYQRLAESDPDNLFAYVRMGVWHEAKGNIQDAYALYEKVAALQPEQPLWPIRAASLFPAMPQPDAVNLQARQALLDSLTNQQSGNASLDLNQAFEARCQPPSYLAYHGKNDCEIKSRFADWMLNALGMQPERLPLRLLTGQKIRLGFLVTENHERVFKRVMGGYLTHLNRDLFDIQIACPESRVAGMQSLFPELRDLNFIALPNRIEPCVSTLQNAALDILFYFEIGTDPKNYLLSLFRCAPVQCTSWGYPTTSGSPNMDYYISSALIEPEDAQTHYREKLWLLQNLPTCYTRPNTPQQLKSRQELNLPDKANLYVCPQTLPKFHPDFDNILSRILEHDPDAEIILVEGLYAHWTQTLKERFRQTIPDFAHRIRFLPQLAYEDYLSLITAADVVLDTLHFGGGITSYEILSLGTPIVTLPGAYMRGRYTLGCYQKMNFHDCVANTPEHYVELACRIATDKNYRESLRSQILQQNHVLFEDVSVVRELEQCLISLTDNARQSD